MMATIIESSHVLICDSYDSEPTTEHMPAWAIAAGPQAAAAAMAGRAGGPAAG